jgi:tetratricopeptide (TPR) repeat protein
MRHVTVLILLTVFSLGAVPSSGQELSAPEKNFEFLWHVFDANYSTFSAKHIDWKALYAVYRPRVSAQTTDDELFAILSHLLEPLNDNHVVLRSQSPARFYSPGMTWGLFNTPQFDNLQAIMRIRPAPARYFARPLVESENKVFAHGWLADGIGYLHFNSFQDEEGSTKAMDAILEEFRDARAIVVDVRRNLGGDDPIGRVLASRFADRKRLYMTTRERNGPRYDDYDPPRHFFVEPLGPRQFTKTVILLTNRLSLSAADNFTLAMRILPHVTVVGDFTSGCQADNDVRTLPNGWMVVVPRNLMLDHKGFCWEGIGVPPDLKVRGEDLAPHPESDLILEMALALINSRQLELKDANEATKGTVSLAGLLEQDLEKEGSVRAVEAFERRKNEAGQTGYYVDFFELSDLAQKLIRSGKGARGEAVYDLLDRLYPDVAQVNEQLAMEYLRMNRKAEARGRLERAVAQQQKKLNPFARQFADYLSDRLLLTISAGNAADLRTECDALQRRYPEAFNEAVLNSIGYKLMGASLLNEAITVFQLNTERYPQSANVWDSLGEAYMNAGDKEKAIADYEKSLQLNPENQNAVDKLKELRRRDGGSIPSSRALLPENSRIREGAHGTGAKRGPDNRTHWRPQMTLTTGFVACAVL